MDDLALDNVDLLNLSGDLRAQGHDVAIYLGVIRVFVQKSIVSEVGCDD
jgi:hypothetical protein